MHILETYALMTGSKINKCFIHEEKIDLPSEKYITFHPYSPRGDSRQYDHWNKVFSLLHDNKSFNYKILQIGQSDDDKYDKYNVDISYLGKTSYYSLAYLMKHSELHFGIDSFPVHIASHYDKKIVAIYFYYSSTCGPYFSSPEKIKILEPDYSNIKPVFQYNDPYHLINTIDPETIYQSVCDLLEIEA
jgi:ADP-heptose:LPS heptosyltransferase